MAIDVLFRPFTYKGLNLPNRVVMAPMTRSFSPNGIVTEDVAQYYRRRAEGAVGLIISEGTGVDRPASLNDPNIPRFHGAQELAGWRRVVDEVHDAGGLMAPQLWHVGAVRTREKDWQPPGAYDSPSGLSRPDKSLGVPMSDEDIADAIRAFADAALAAKRSNFDAWNNTLANQALSSGWYGNNPDAERTHKLQSAGLSFLAGIEPKDQLEGMHSCSHLTTRQWSAIAEP